MVRPLLLSVVFLGACSAEVRDAPIVIEPVPYAEQVKTVDLEIYHYESGLGLNESIGYIAEAYLDHEIVVTHTITEIYDQVASDNNIYVQHDLVREFNVRYKRRPGSIFILVVGGGYSVYGLGGPGRSLFIAPIEDFTALDTAKLIAHEMGHYYGLPHSEFYESVLGPDYGEMDRVDYADVEWMTIEENENDWND